jgi:predicted glycosyltransferase
MRGTTSMLVTHDLSLVREADEILLVEHGRIAARGTYEELLRDSTGFRRLAGQARQSAPAARVPVAPGGPRGARVLFYSHNGVGVGHLQRQLDLAAAYKARHPEAATLLATGSHAAGLFSIPPGVDYLKLPTITMVDRYENWDPRDLPVPREDVVAMRTELLEGAVRRFAPDLLVADFMPAGPYGELLPALDALAAAGGVAVAGFRDVVDDPGHVRDLWARTGVYETLRRRYAAICVYGDPGMVDFAAAYGLDDELAARVRYCGYLGRGPQAASDAPLYERPLVLATGGGGVDGGAMLGAFVEAAGRLRPRRGGRWMAVTGPLCDQAMHDRLVRLGEAVGVDVRRLVPELRAHVALADCVVGMAGYNTACDLLSYRRRAVLVPRAAPSREQAIRAERLAEWGVARMLPAAEADGDGLAAAIAAALDGPAPPAPPVSTDGLRSAVDAFDATLASIGVPV